MIWRRFEGMDGGHHFAVQDCMTLAPMKSVIIATNHAKTCGF
jgi:hypothetical protein